MDGANMEGAGIDAAGIGTRTMNNDRSGEDKRQNRHCSKREINRR